MSKVTWEDIYEEYKAKFPNISKLAIHWEPYRYGEIKIELQDGLVMVYDHDDKTAWFLNRKENCR